MKNNDLTSGFFSNNYEEAIELFDGQRNKDALVLFKEVLKEAPNNPKQLAEIYFYIGRISLRLKNNEEALVNFKKAIQEQPEDIRLIDKLGETYFKLGDYQKAANYCDQIIAFNPSLLKPYYNKGNMLLNLTIETNLEDSKIGKQAIKCYKKALKILPDNDQKIDYQL